MTETSTAPFPESEHLNGHVNGVSCSVEDQYDVTEEARKVLYEGILSNPVISKDLPENISKYAESISFKGSKAPIIPINWRFAESVSALKGLEGALVNVLLSRKYGVEPQKIEVDTDHAQLFIMSTLLYKLSVTSPDSTESLNFATFTEPEKKHIMEPLFPNYDIHDYAGGYMRNCTTNIYKTSDDRYFHLHGSLNPDISMKSIGIDPSTDVSSYNEAVALFQDVMSKISSTEMQHLATDVYKQAGTIGLTIEEYQNSEHGKANAHIGLFDIHLASTSSSQRPSWWNASSETGPARPLAGLKVVDLTRIIAAPAVSRGLAELGASVMRVTSPNLPDFSVLHPDLGQGKWSCHLDLKSTHDREKLKQLILDADVVVSGYRPGVMEKWGFGPKDIFELCKERDRGIIVARENCYGWNGPWHERSGWQQISDINCGVSMEFGRAMGNNEPVTPVFPNSDYCTGIAGTCGIITALLRRGESGGSYRVDLALNYYSQWLVNSVGMYSLWQWKKLWGQYGNKVFRHYHNMNILLFEYLKMLQTPGAPANVLWKPEFYQEQECPVLSKKAGTKVTLTSVKPILRFPDNVVKPGFAISPRGNGFDEAKWPEDLRVDWVR